MTKNAEILSLQLNKKKTWLNSWYSCSNDYASLLQEDFNLFLFFRSFNLSMNNINVLNVRLYRNKNYVFFDLLLNIETLNAIKKNILFNKINNSFNKVAFYKKQLFLIITKNKDFNQLICASYVASKIAVLIERRVKFRSKLFKTFFSKLEKACFGLCTQISGRINNVNMARHDTVLIGTLPIQSNKYNVDFCMTIANTNKGLQSIKVWIYK